MLALFDIDHFKRVNDTWGHLAGDRVLAAVGAALSWGIRGSDVAVRYGGEELALFLLQEDLAHAALVAERIRRDVAALRFDDIAPDVRVTISAGVAARRAGDELNDLIADRPRRRGAVLRQVGGPRPCLRRLMTVIVRGLAQCGVFAIVSSTCLQSTRPLGRPSQDLA